jgi:MFS family permease
MIREILALGALIVGMCGLLLGNGLFGTLTALRMSEEGFDPTIIGVVLSCHSIGFIVGCLYGQRIIQRIGHIQCFTAFAAVLAVVCLILPMSVNPYSWILLRLVFGFCSAMVFMVAESWLTGAASSEKNGRVFSIYMVINKGSFGAGQLLLLLGDPSGDRLFMLMAILFCLCLVPERVRTIHRRRSGVKRSQKSRTRRRRLRVLDRQTVLTREARLGKCAFTKALVEGLNGKANLFGEGTITVASLDAYISNRVTKLTEGRQTPATGKPVGPNFTFVSLR